MILEFEDEMAKLGRMEVEKNNELKTLNDNFKRSLDGSETSVLCATRLCRAPQMATSRINNSKR